MELRCTLHPSVDAGSGNNPVAVDTFEELLQLIGTHQVTLRKEDAELISAALYPDPYLKRNDANVTGHGRIFIADFDACSSEQTDQILDLAAGWRALFYTSHNHGKIKKETDPGTDRFRLIFELTRGLTANEFRKLWSHLQHHFKGWMDSTGKALSRCYYLPSCPPDSTADAVWEMLDGEPLDVDAWLARAPVGETHAKADEEILAEEDISALAARLVRRVSPHQKKMGRMLKNLVKGLPLAPDGNRDKTIWDVVATIVDAFPHVASEPLAQIFERSLAEMPGKDGFIPVDKVRQKIDRHKQTVADREAEQLAKAQSEREALIRASTDGARESVASEQELDQCCRRLETTRSNLFNFFIIGRQSWFSLLRANGTYGPLVHVSDLGERARQDLAVFGDLPLYLETDKGTRRSRSVSEWRKHGQVLDTIVYSLIAQESTYDWKTKTLTIASAPERVTPAYCEYSHTLLKLMGGDKLLDWVATTARLDKPNSALALIGEKGAGKTWLSQALARIWTTRAPVGLDALSGRFSFDLAACPLVAAQERMDDAYYKHGSAYLRDQLSLTYRRIEEKYQPKVTLYGSIRVILTANSLNNLLTEEVLNQADMAALGERILHISVTKDSEDFWRSLDTDTRENLYHSDSLARHSLWLRENRPVTAGNRFLVEGQPSELHQKLAIGKGVVAEVVTWLLNYLSNPVKLDNKRLLAVRIKHKALLCTAQGIAQNWSDYSETQPLTQTKIAQAIVGLSRYKRKLMDGRGQRLNYHVIEPAALRPALDGSGMTEEGFLAAFSKDTQETPL